MSSPTPNPLPLLQVPFLPDKDLVTNARDGRLHWSKRSLWVRKSREDFGLLLRAAGIEELRRRMPIEPLALRWLLTLPAWRGDVDGWMAALKVWTDALVDVGLLPHDGPQVIRQVTVQVERDPQRAPVTTLWVEHL